MKPFRPGTTDKLVYDEVYTNNCYRVPESLLGKVVIDVGAHCGYFAKLCAERGASVLGFELEDENAAIATENLAEFPQVRIMCKAVWRESGMNMVAKSGMYRTADDTLLNTGSSHITLAQGPHTNDDGWIETITVDEILEPFDKVAILKADCEGAEFEIVPATKSWDKVERLVGEVHGFIREYHVPDFYKEVKKHFPKLEVISSCHEFGLDIFFASR